MRRFTGDMSSHANSHFVLISQEISGADDLSSVTFLEIKLNTEDITMRDLGMYSLYLS